MKIMSIVNPYNQDILGEVTLIDADKVAKIVNKVHKAFIDRDHWLTPHRRIEILEKFANLLQANLSTLATLAAAEGGKPLQDSIVEVTRAINGVKVAIQQIPELVGRQIPMGLTPNSDHRIAFTYREPVGVVLGISAFNHPVNLIIHQIAPAIACGCPVIIKPAVATPLSCIKIVMYLYDAGLPQQFCQLLLCEHDVLETVVRDPRISFLSFIGSSKVGWDLRAKLAPGSQCALEHGGAAPVIIEKDAVLDEVLPLLIKGGFYHAGQVCVSTQRIFVHKQIIKEVAQRLTELAKKLKVGDPQDPATEVGPLIRHDEVDRVDSWVQQAVQQGAKLLCGGNKLSACCYAPTILLDPPPDAKVSQLEIFGPVICLYSYTNRLAAIAAANQVPFCFQAAVLTQDIDVALDTVKRLNATAVMVNDHTAFRVDWMPFGGRGESGLNMGGIVNAMHDMSYEKLMVIHSPLL